MKILRRYVPYISCGQSGPVTPFQDGTTDREIPYLFDNCLKDDLFTSLSRDETKWWCFGKQETEQTITQMMADQGRSELLCSFNHNPLRH